MRHSALAKPMIFLCRAEDIPDGQARRVGLAGWPPLALFNLAGQFYATHDRCTHGDASLSNGEIDGGLVICPLHFGSFDIATGAPVDAPCTVALKTVRVLLRDGGLYLDPEDGG